MTVQNFMKIVWTVFEKFEIFMKRSGEKKQKKRHDCISSRKFFPTPKKIHVGTKVGFALLKSSLLCLRGCHSLKRQPEVTPSATVQLGRGEAS